MPSSNTQTSCPSCSAVLAAAETRCDKCGTLLSQSEQDGNTSDNRDDADYVVGDGNLSSEYSGIFQMAEDVDHGPDKAHDEKPPNGPLKSQQHSGYSGIFQLAEDSRSDPKPAPPQSGGSNAGSPGLSGVLQFAENARAGVSH